ncbi:MAG: hypothetical protein IMW91_00680 [Firmicutes bacterium]|nr:hypothetical protein [Bacillota bacterium]
MRGERIWGIWVLAAVALCVMLLAGCAPTPRAQYERLLDALQQMRQYHLQGRMIWVGPQGSDRYRLEVWQRKDGALRLSVSDGSGQLLVRNAQGLFLLTPAAGERLRLPNGWTPQALPYLPGGMVAFLKQSVFTPPVREGKGWVVRCNGIGTPLYASIEIQFGPNRRPVRFQSEDQTGRFRLMVFFDRWETPAQMEDRLFATPLPSKNTAGTQGRYLAVLSKQEWIETSVGGAEAIHTGRLVSIGPLLGAVWSGPTGASLLWWGDQRGWHTFGGSLAAGAAQEEVATLIAPP